MGIWTVYVRSPLSAVGRVTGVDSYCVDGTPHPVCQGAAGWRSPTDIGGGGTLTLRVNYPNVKGIRTYVGLQCCSDSYPADLRRVVIVQLYGAHPIPGCAPIYIGSILFGHVASPQVDNDRWYDLTSGEKVLGTVATQTAPPCSTGPHTHMQVMPGGTRLVSCDQQVSSSTSIYTWTWSDDNQPC